MPTWKRQSQKVVEENLTATTKEKTHMRSIKTLIAVLAVLVAAMGVSASTASAASYCGTPAFTKSQFQSGWKSGPLAAAAEKYVRANSSYYHINRDQGFQSWLKQPQIQSVMTPAGYRLSANTYCPGGRSYSPYSGKLSHSKQRVIAWCQSNRSVKTTTFTRNGEKYLKTVTTTSKTCQPIVKSYCRNLVKGKPFTKTTRHVVIKKIKKPGPECPCKPPAVCDIGFVMNANGNCVQQRQDCSAGNHWDDSQQACVQNDCGNVTVINGDNNTVNQGGNCNNNPPPTCEQQGNCPPPPPPPTCPDGRPVPSNGDCDRAPQISVVWPPHVLKGGSQAVWIEASDPDGDSLATPNFTSTDSTQYAHVASVVPVDVRWDGTQCPTGVSCYRGTLWGDQVGFAHFVATVTAGGKSAAVNGTVEVKPDTF